MILSNVNGVNVHIDRGVSMNPELYRDDKITLIISNCAQAFITSVSMREKELEVRIFAGSSCKVSTEHKDGSIFILITK